MARVNANENIEPPKERIDLNTWILMTATSIGADIFQASLLIFASVASPIIFMTFWIWLKLHGVTIGDSIQRLAVMFGGFLIELIPILNILPAWTLAIFITVLLVRNEDKNKIKEFYRNYNTSPQQV